MRSLRHHPLVTLLLLAAALRVAVTWSASAHHPDEIFQYLEQAHRLVFGYGYIPWEYRDGMRSWLVPALLAGPMWLGSVLAPDGRAYLLLPRLAVALSTLGIVWGAWSLAARTSRLHATVAAFVAATWIDQVYFAGHTLTETIAVAAAVPGMALLFGNDPVRPEPVERRTELWALAGAGALLAFAALVRIHYVPALAIVVVWRCRLDLRTWGLVIAGASPVLVASALIDVAMGMTPYSWVVANIKRNVIDGASATYGVSGPFYYLAELKTWWGYAFVPLVFLAFFGSQRYPALLAAAIVTVAVHMAIGHKELRFVLLAMTLLAILAAIGTATLIEMATPRHRPIATIASLSAWTLASLTIALTGEMRFRWANESPALSAAALAGRDPKLCGLATYDLRYWQSGGYAFLHRDVPIYPVTARDELGYPPMDAGTLKRISPGFDAILTTPAGMAAMPADYALVACRIPGAPLTTLADRTGRAICLYRRPGTCDPIVASAWRLR